MPDGTVARIVFVEFWRRCTETIVYHAAHRKLDLTVASTVVPLCKTRVSSCKYLLTAICSYCTSLYQILTSF